MADISIFPLVRHLRGGPTMYLRHLRRGRLVHDGTGLSFFYRPLSAVLSEVPVDDRELALLFHARTADFQDLTVQASVTFRVTEPATACARIDFSIDPITGRWRGTPLDQLAGLLTETAQQQVLGLIAGRPLASVLADGVDQIRDRMLTGLTAEPRLAETGIEVMGARVVAVRPEPEVEKALRTPAREQLQQDADRATYERRAVAVQRERAIAENELQNQIELARQEEQLVSQRGANARREAEEAAAAAGIEAEGQAARDERLAVGQAARTRLLGQAQADSAQALGAAQAVSARALGAAQAAGEAARMAAYRDMPDRVLLALAARELAGRLPQIGTLALTPDLLTPLLARLNGGPAPARLGPGTDAGPGTGTGTGTGGGTGPGVVQP